MVVAAWITNSDLPLAYAALPQNADRANFEDRFFLSFEDRFLAAMRGEAWRRSASVSTKAKAAEAPFAQRWPRDLRASIADDETAAAGPLAAPARSVAANEIPLPRSRPAEADQPARPVVIATALALADSARQADRSLLQKFSDVVTGRVTLASLTPGVGGLFRRGPDLASFGYDSLTAVYDISARAVYLPNGVTLEAHSGLGNLRDDPDHVSVPNVGSTPPAIYSLKPREKEFHGVAALRMIPAEGSDIGGRSGLLVHSFMLGPNGDSNGCVSIKEYDRFLKAFNDGEINRIAVVPSLKAMTLAAQNPT